MCNVLVWILVTMLGMGSTALPALSCNNEDCDYDNCTSEICYDDKCSESEDCTNIICDYNQNSDCENDCNDENQLPDSSQDNYSNIACPNNDCSSTDESKTENQQNNNDSNNYSNPNVSEGTENNYNNIEDIISNLISNQSQYNYNNSNNQSASQSSDLSALASQVVDIVNQERQAAGLNPVSVDSNVQAAAQLRATEIQSVFSHTRPNGSSCFTALKESGVTYRGAGENIAKGQTSAQQVMQGWMNSQGHRANILNKNFTKIGVGVYKANGTYHWTQMFIY